MGRNIRTQRLLTCLFSIRLFLDVGLLPLANRVSARHYNVLFLNRLQYRPAGSGVVTWVWIAVAVGWSGEERD